MKNYKQQYGYVVVFLLSIFGLRRARWLSSGRVLNSSTGMSSFSCSHSFGLRRERWLSSVG